MRLHLVAPDETGAHAVDFVRVRPVGFVDHDAVAIDQIDHVRQGSVGAVRGAGGIVDENRDFADLFELAEFSRVCEFLLSGVVVRIVFARVRFARVDYEKLKILRLILAMEFGQRGNLPHEGRSGDAAEFEQHVLLAGERRQRKQIPVEIGQDEIRRSASDGGDGPEVRHPDVALSVTLVVVTAHGGLLRLPSSTMTNLRKTEIRWLSADEGELRFEVRQILVNDFPNNFCVNIEIIVDHTISQANDFALLDL